MKHRPFLWITLLFLSIAAFSNIAVAMQSIDPDAPMQPESMASYFPEGTDFLISARVDEAFFAQLDQFALMLTGGFEAYDVPRVSLRDALRASNLDLDIVLPWLGEYVAFGVEADEENVLDYDALYLVAQIDDEAGARAFASMVGFTGDGDVMTQQSSSQMMIRFLDGIVIISQEDTALPEGNTLADNPDFQRVIGALPAEGYNAIAYASESVYQTGVSSMAMPSGQENPFGASNDVALGLTILDGNTYTIDTAQLPVDDAVVTTVTGIDPAFTQFIPASSNLFVQATNLSNLIDTGLNVVDQFASINVGMSTVDGVMATSVPMPSPREQIESGFGLVGIDFQEDILDWTTGDFAFVGRADVRDIAEVAILSQSAGAALQNSFDFGILIEAVDPAGAQRLVERVNTLLDQFGGNSTEVELGSEMIGGTEVTTIDAYPILTTYPETDKLAIRLLFGANDDLFFFGTRGTITEMLSGAESIADTEAYADAGRYILPNATTIAYTDDEGFIVGLAGSPFGVIPLALLGPAIGNIFNNIVAELNSGMILTPTPTPSPTPSPTPDVDALLSPLDYLIDTIYHSTLSSTVTDEGITLIRITATLKN